MSEANGPLVRGAYTHFGALLKFLTGSVKELRISACCRKHHSDVCQCQKSDLTGMEMGIHVGEKGVGNWPGIGVRTASKAKAGALEQQVDENDGLGHFLANKVKCMDMIGMDVGRIVAQRWTI